MIKNSVPKIILSALLLLNLTGIIEAADLSIFKQSESREISAIGSEELYISAPQNISGEVKFAVGDGNSVYADIEYVGKAENYEEFKWFKDLITMKIAKEGKQSAIIITTPDNAPWEGLDKSVVLNMSFRMPSSMKIKIKARFHSIEVNGHFKGLEVDNDYGEVIAEKVDGDIDIRTSYKPVIINNINGYVNIQNHSGDIIARNIAEGERKCNFETTYGKIVLEKIYGGFKAATSYKPIMLKQIDSKDGIIKVSDSYGKININKFSGLLDLKTEFSDIEGEDLDFSEGSSKISNSFNSITLKNLRLNRSELMIDNSFADVSISLNGNSSVHFILSTGEGGAIHIKGMSVKPIAISYNSFEGITGKGDSELKVNIQGIGRINITGTSSKRGKSY